MDYDAEIVQSISRAVRPTGVGSSVMTSMRVLTTIVHFVLWILCLPFDLVTRRHIGKRHMATLLVLLSLIALSAASLVLLRVGFLQAKAHASQVPRILPFAMLMAATMIAFCCHYIANRRRFGTPAQGHSFSSGIPWWCYPSGLSECEGAHELLARITMELASAPPQPVGFLRRAQAYPTTMVRNIKQLVRPHIAMLLRDEVPYGPFVWFATSIVEPIGLLAIGALTMLVPGGTPFGLYLIGVGFALRLKTMILQAEWLERAYNEIDAELETQALRDWRSGRQLEEVSRRFIVPVSKAFIPRPRHPSDPTIVGPGFNGQMTLDEMYPDSQGERDAAA